MKEFRPKMSWGVFGTLKDRWGQQSLVETRGQQPQQRVEQLVEQQAGVAG